jgi:protein-tyrosine-phosphatase
MPSVLFICTANRFRSPLAAAVFSRALEEEPDRQIAGAIRKAGKWRVCSAGTWATPGQPVLPEVLQAAQTLGLDLTDHRSERVSGELISEYDLVLVMQSSQKEALLSEFPQLEEYVYLFSHVVERGSYDIPDSFESEQEVIEVAAEMDELIRRGLRYIAVLANALHNQRARVNEWKRANQSINASSA